MKDAKELGGICRKRKLRKVCRVEESSKSCAKFKTKREPLPMKLRALPQSFWQQPNNTPCISPGAVYPVLSPIAKDDSNLCLESKTTQIDIENSARIETISDANTDLLFSLFRGFDNDQLIKTKEKTKSSVNTRGRPKKGPGKGVVLRDEDPYLGSGAADSLKPLLPVRTAPKDSIQNLITQGEQVLAMVSMGMNESNVAVVNGSNSNDDNNYSHILSELVIQL